MAPSPTVLHRRARLLRGGIAAGLLAALLGMAFVDVPTASGDPISDAQAQAAVLARQINDEGRQVEILAEQFDGAQVHADQVDAQLADATKKIAAAQATAEQTRNALAAEAVTAYMHGGYVSQPELKAYSGHDDLSVEQGYFDLATNDQAGVIGQARAAEAQLKVQQTALQAAKVDAAAALTALTQRRQAVEQADAAARLTLSRVQGQLVQLVAAKQAQIAAQQQAQEEAVLAAQQTPTSTVAPAKTTAAQTPKAAATTATVAPTARSATTATTRAAAVPATHSTTVAAPAPTPVATAPRPAPTATTVAPVKVAPAPVVAPAPTPVAAPAPKPAPPASSRGLAAVAFARSQLGKPYAFGAAGPATYDCSGLTMMAWRAAGVSLDHYAADQYAYTAHIPIADLQPGDLVFFGSDLHHVGIYVGGGMMIDAPHTGTVVRYDPIFWPDLQPFGGRPG